MFTGKFSVMDFLYVAKAINLSSGEVMDCRKVGIALSDIDKRISSLNSTKMPIAVELEAGFDFSGSSLSARDAEYIIHSVLSHDRVNGEWFKDLDGDLVDCVGKAALRMDAQLFTSEDDDIKEMNQKRRAARVKMETVIGPLSEVFGRLGFDWEYMTWKVGVTTSLGRLQINVNDNNLRLVLSSDESLEGLIEKTHFDWVQYQLTNRKALSILPSNLIAVLTSLA